MLLAHYGEEIIGGVLFLEGKDTVYYKFNASAPAQHLSRRPNDRVIWGAIQHWRGKGFQQLDFGLSDWDQHELIRYKQKYASEEKTITFLRHLPEGEPSTREVETRGLLSHLAGLLTEETVPDDVTDRAGDLLYRYFA